MLVHVIKGIQTTLSKTLWGQEENLFHLKEKDDIEAYLVTFEKTMKALQIERSIDPLCVRHLS